MVLVQRRPERPTRYQPRATPWANCFWPFRPFLTAQLEFCQGVSHDFVMVESKWREGIDGKPLGVGGIILSTHLQWLIDNGKVCDGYGAPTWVSIHLGIGSNLLYAAYFQSCFLFQFSNGTLLRRLIHIEEATRDCPPTFIGFISTFNEQHTRLNLGSYHHAISGDSRSWIFISVTHDPTPLCSWFRQFLMKTFLEEPSVYFSIHSPCGDSNRRPCKS